MLVIVKVTFQQNSHIGDKILKKQVILEIPEHYLIHQDVSQIAKNECSNYSREKLLTKLD